MKTNRNLIQIWLLCAALLPAVGQAEDYTYTTNADNTLTITAYTGPGGDVTIPDRIPDTIDGLTVTSIGDGAFSYCWNLTSVTIPDSATTIGDNAFAECYYLTSVTIGTNVTSIGDWAFADCYSLTNVIIPDSVTSIGDLAFAGTCLTGVTIPKSVTSIGNGAFSSCTGLTNITVDAQNAFYTSVNGVLFDQSQTTLIECPGGKAGNYIVPNSVTSIADWTFGGCSGLTNVSIGNSVTNIGSSAFEYCTSLTSVTIPNSVTSIAD